MLTTERRAHQRIRYSEEVHTHYGVRFTQKTWTKDISDGGLLLLGHAPGPPGEMLQIEMSVDGQPGVTLSRWAQIV